jgi:hypothetical protein
MAEPRGNKKNTKQSKTKQNKKQVSLVTFLAKQYNMLETKRKRKKGTRMPFFRVKSFRAAQVNSRFIESLNRFFFLFSHVSLFLLLLPLRCIISFLAFCDCVSDKEISF